MTAPTVPATRSDREPFASTDWLLFSAIGLIWGSSFVLIKIGLEAFHPGLITWARVGLGALALAVMPAARRPIEKEDRRRIYQLGVLWVAIPFTLFPLAQEHINSAVTGLLNGATPIFAGLIGALWFNRVPRGPQRWGIATGFLGIALISFGSSAEGGTAFVGVLLGGGTPIQAGAVQVLVLVGLLAAETVTVVVAYQLMKGSCLLPPDLRSRLIA